jgi:hypothetical protein
LTDSTIRPKRFGWPKNDFQPGDVEHCPDFDERFTLNDGRTLAVPYPRSGWNCHNGLGLAQDHVLSDSTIRPKRFGYPGNEFEPSQVEHCPDFDERFTLKNGRTRAVPYPLEGWNCNPGLGLAQ